MIELSGRERQLLSRFFARLDDDDVEYVVLRKYEQLPERVLGDVDLFVEPAAFERAVELSEDVGFESAGGGDASPPAPLRTALRHPIDAVKAGLRSPSAVARAVPTRRPRSSDGVAVRHRQYGGVELELRNHVRFPEQGGTRVPAAVEASLLDRRERCGEVYAPSAADELAHVVAHCLADYDRTFPEYYVERCDRLRETVSSDPRERAQFGDLLAHLFGDDAASVFSAVAVGEYESIGAAFAFAPEPRLPSRFSPTHRRSDRSAR